MIRIIRAAGLCSLLIGLSPLHAQPDADDQPPRFDVVTPPAWHEQDIDLPTYPESRDLIPVDIHVPGSRLEAFIDESSVSVGKDNVVRYTLVLQSSTGGDNALYEGIHCGRKEYRTYAIGTSEKRFAHANDSTWKKIRALGSTRYRDQLYRFYFCDIPSKGLSLRDIMFNLKSNRVLNDDLQ